MGHRALITRDACVMQRIRNIGVVGVAACSVLAAAVGILWRIQIARADDPVVEHRDTGGSGDFDQTQNIFFDKSGAFGGSLSPSYWNFTAYTSGGALYENNTGCWFADAPPKDATNVIGSRCIKFHHYGRFRVKAGRFPEGGDLFLSGCPRITCEFS